jgi:PAS domain S-box-containing protein
MKRSEAPMQATGVGRPIRILHVEDSPEDAELVRSLLESDLPGVEILRVEDAGTFQKALESGLFDLVLSDYTLPSFDALSALRLTREIGPDTPFIVVSGMVGEDRAVESLKAGATDYVLKDRLSRLGSAVQRVVEESRVRRKRREAEAALERNAERLRLVTRATNDAIFDWDLASNQVWLSEGFETLFGYETTGSEPTVDFFRRRLHPEDRDRVLAGIQETIDRGGTAWSGEYRFERADGSYRYVFDRRYVMRESGRAVRVIGALMDIDARKRAEEELRESEERYRSIVETTNEWIWASDLQGRLTYSNQASQVILGHPPESLVGMARWDLVHADDLPAAREPFRRSIAERAGWTGLVLRWRHSNGTYRHLESNAVPFFDASGQLIGFRGASRDITERIQLEAQLLQSQKMEAIGTLAGGVAHDFNNLLTSILGYSDIVLQELPSEDPLREDVEEIRKAGERAAALTRQLLAFSRKQILKPVVLDLDAVVADLEKMVRRLIGEDIEMVVSLDPDLGRVKADAGQIEQVVMNLVINARDAMPRGGKLTIETSNAEMDDSYIRRHAGAMTGSYVCLAVTDTGTGMDRETQSRIFEPFFTTKGPGKGTGLGLSTAYGIVKQSGGYISVDSELGKGTTFRVYLPRVFDSDHVVPAAKAPQPSTGRETILLTEDEEGLRVLAKRILKAHGYVVLEASGGEDALRIAQAHPGPIHLLLTDAVMPGMGGSELARRITVDRPQTRVLYMSGYTDDAVVRHGLLEAGTAFIQKPFTTEALAGKVRAVLDGKGTRELSLPRDPIEEAAKAEAR